MEREAKYRATRRIKAKQIEQLELWPYRLGERHNHTLRDTLLDTADRALSQAHYGLRVRRDGDTTLLTLKAPGTVEGATHERPEFESTIDAKHPERAEYWPTEIRQKVVAVAGNTDVQPLLQIRNRRRTWDVFKDAQRVAELALDRGTIQAGGHSRTFHEVEIETKDAGSADDLTNLERLLTAVLPLVPEQRSKMERGVALLEHRDPEREEALKQASQRVPMTPTAPLAEAGRSVVAEHLLKFYRSLAIAREGTDPEGIHDVRVATRRARAVLAVLGETVFDAKRTKKLRKGLGSIAKAAGAVRDADVFLHALDDYAADLDVETAAQLQPMRDMLLAQRDAGRHDLLAVLDDSATERFLQRLDKLLLTPGAAVAAPAGDADERQPTLVRHFSGSQLWSHYERVRAYEVDLAEAPVATLHRLRIEIKHLRYVLEFFRPALAAEADALLEHLVAAQDHLGDLHDMEVAIGLVDTALVEHADAALLHAYRAERVTRYNQLYAATPKVLRPILDLPFRRRLASLISKP